MNDPQDRYLHAALDELYRGGPDEDLPERILQRDAQSPDLRIVRDAPAPRRLRRILWPAACAVLALGLVALLFYPREKELPVSISASETGYRVSDDGVELDSGWYVVDSGAPLMKAGGSSVAQITGRAVVKVGEIPDDSELQAHREWLRRHGVEENMIAGNWIKAGGMAICLLAGSAMVNGRTLQAQTVKEKPQQDQQHKLDEKDEGAAKELKKVVDEGEEELEQRRKQLALDKLKYNLKATRESITKQEAAVVKAEANGNETELKKLKATLAKLKGLESELSKQIEHTQLEINVMVVEARIADEQQAVGKLEKQSKENPNNLGTRGELKTHKRTLADLKSKAAELKTQLKDLESEDNTPDPNRPISVDFVQKDIHVVTHYIALRSGLQLIIEGDLDVTVSAQFHDMKPREIIRAICKANNLSMIEDGNIIIIKQGGSGGAHVTPSRDVDPDAPISVAYEDMPLSRAVVDIQSRSGLDVKLELPAGEDPTVTLSLKSLPPSNILKLICEMAGLRVLDRGDQLIVRRSLSDMTGKEIESELRATQDIHDTVESQYLLAKVALDGARETKDADAIKAAQKDVAKLKFKLDELNDEIAALKKALKSKKH